MRRVRDVLLLESDEPATYAEAMVSPDFEEWLEAMRSELKSMDDNHVWDLVDPPPGITAIGDITPQCDPSRRGCVTLLATHK